MSDIIEFLLRRRSVPPAFLTEPGPDRRQLETLLTIASRVPDHGKLQPWRFIVYQGAGRERAGRTVLQAFQAKVPAADEGARAKEAGRFAAPLVVAVVSTAADHPKIPVSEQRASAAAACENLVIAATAMGFGASWLTGWFAYEPSVLADLGVREGETVTGFIHIGTPRETIPDRPRPELSTIVTHFRGGI